MPFIIPPGVDIFGGGTVKTNGNTYSTSTRSGRDDGGRSIGGSFGPGKGKGSAPARGGQGNPLIDGLLGLLGGGGGGGSYYAGYDGTAARQAAQAGYDRSIGNTRNVFGQIDREVKGRVPAIQAGYQKATADLRGDVAARQASDAARNAEADQRNAATAAAQGLTVVQPNNTRADEIQQAGQNAYAANAQAWAGFNGAAEQTAVERNRATGDTFAYAGTQNEQQLATLLQQALDSISAQEAANPGGYSGGGGGGGNDLSIYKLLLGYDTDQRKLAMAQQEAAAKNAPQGLGAISPAGWAAINSAYAKGASTNAQVAQQLAKTGNQRDLAYWLGQ